MSSGSDSSDSPASAPRSGLDTIPGDGRDPTGDAPRGRREVSEHPALMLAWVASLGMLSWALPDRPWWLTTLAGFSSAAFAFLLIRVFVVGYTGYERLLGLRIIRRERDVAWTRWVLWTSGAAVALSLPTLFALRGVDGGGGLLAALRLALVILVALGSFLFLLMLIAQRFSVFGTLSIFGVVLGVAALVVVQSVASGFQHEFERRVLGVYSHINVTRHYGLPEYRRFETWLRGMDGVQGASPFVYYAMAIAPDDPRGEREGDIRLASVLVKGIEPATAPGVIDIVEHLEKGSGGSVDALTSDLHLMPVKDRSDDMLPLPVRSIPDPRGDGWYEEALSAWEASREVQRAEGSSFDRLRGKSDDVWVDPPLPDGPEPDAGAEGEPAQAAAAVGDGDLPTMFIGKSLAKELQLEVGDTVRLVDPGATFDHAEEPKFRHYAIAGVFEAGFQEYDSRLVYVHIKELQHFKFRGKDYVSGVDLRLDEAGMAPQVGARIRAVLDEDAGNQVLEWQELNENLFNSIRTQKNAITIVLSLVILVASFNVLAALWTMVVRRTPEVAIVMSMGGTGPQVARSFQVTGMTIGLAGSVAGVILGLVLCLLVHIYGYGLDPEVYFIESLPVEVSPVQIGWILGLALTICFVATIPPALHASWMRPLEGLRYE